MVSKNNTRLYDDKMNKKDFKYAIKKLNVGVASVLVGVTFGLSSMALNSAQANADETTNTATATDTSSQNLQNNEVALSNNDQATTADDQATTNTLNVSDLADDANASTPAANQASTPTTRSIDPSILNDDANFAQHLEESKVATPKVSTTAKSDRDAYKDYQGVIDTNYLKS